MAECYYLYSKKLVRATPPPLGSLRVWFCRQNHVLARRQVSPTPFLSPTRPQRHVQRRRLAAPFVCGPVHHQSIHRRRPPRQALSRAGRHGLRRRRPPETHEVAFRTPAGPRGSGTPSYGLRRTRLHRAVGATGQSSLRATPSRRWRSSPQSWPPPRGPSSAYPVPGADCAGGSSLAARRRDE
jgi:hypothetical protein